MIQLNYRDARPIYLQIVENYRLQIRSGILEHGEKLPSVRELATQLAINPNTIARAYRELEAEGWIATVPGKGCFVCGVPGAENHKNLLAELDRVWASLLEAGFTEDALIARLQQGGNHHA